LQAIAALEELKRLLDYDPITGVIRWRVNIFCGEYGSRLVVKAGSEAGTFERTGHRVISINSIRYYAHRLAWKLHYSEEPPPEIDHINRKAADNSIKNLRIASHQQNASNISIVSANTSGCIGVTWAIRDKKRSVTVVANGKRHNIGDFADYNAAVAARIKAASELFGEFSPHRRVATASIIARRSA
jgi:HNH endonuclease